MKREPEHSLASFAALTDPKTGIIRGVDLVRLGEADPRVFLAYAEPADTTVLTGIRAANKGAACAATADRAILRACGESLERYCSAHYDETKLVYATGAELMRRGHAIIAPNELYPYHAEQYSQPGFPFAPTTPETAICWTIGTSFEGDDVHVPASCVYVPYRFRDSVEPFTHMPISTGLAAGRDLDFCIEKGVCEILERDALMIGWIHRRSPPRILPDSVAGLSPDIDELLAAMPPGADLFLTYLTLDIPLPIFGAALIDRGDPPRTSFGISADANPFAALRSAIEEAMLTRSLVNRMADGHSARDDIRTLHDHLKAHAFSSWGREAMRFLVEDGPVWEWSQVCAAAAGVTSALEAVRRQGWPGAWVEVTTPDVAEYGFRVVRTVMPGFQPLNNDHRFRYSGGSRLVSVPAALGMPPRDVSRHNRDPHPFP